MISSAWAFGSKYDSSSQQSDDKEEDKTQTSERVEKQTEPPSTLNNEGVFTFPVPDTLKLENISSSPNASATNNFQILESLKEQDDPQSVGAPYKLLAEFFDKKNKTPMTDVETAGVMSLLDRLQQKTDDSTCIPSNQIPLIHHPSLSGFEKYPNTSNQFIPDYKKRSFTDSTTNSEQGAFSFRQRFGTRNPKGLPRYSLVFPDDMTREIPNTLSFKPRKNTKLEPLPMTFSESIKAEALTDNVDSDQSYGDVFFENLLNSKELDTEVAASAGQTSEADGLTKDQSVPFSLEPVDSLQEASIPKNELKPSKFVSSPKQSSHAKGLFVNPYSSTASRSSSRSYKTQKDAFRPENPLRNADSEGSYKDNNKNQSLGPHGASSKANFSVFQRKFNKMDFDKYRPNISSSLGHSDAVESMFPKLRHRDKYVKKHFDRPKVVHQWSAPDGYLEDEEDTGAYVNEEPQNNMDNKALCANDNSFSLRGILSVTEEKQPQSQKQSGSAEFSKFDFSKSKDKVFARKKSDVFKPGDDSVDNGEVSSSTWLTFEDTTSPTPRLKVASSTPMKVVDSKDTIVNQPLSTTGVEITSSAVSFGASHKDSTAVAINQTASRNFSFGNIGKDKDVDRKDKSINVEPKLLPNVSGGNELERDEYLLQDAPTSSDLLVIGLKRKDQEEEADDSVSTKIKRPPLVGDEELSLGLLKPLELGAGAEYGTMQATLDSGTSSITSLLGLGNGIGRKHVSEEDGFGLLNKTDKQFGNNDDTDGCEHYPTATSLSSQQTTDIIAEQDEQQEDQDVAGVAFQFPESFQVTSPKASLDPSVSASFYKDYGFEN